MPVGPADADDKVARQNDRDEAGHGNGSTKERVHNLDPVVGGEEKRERRQTHQERVEDLESGRESTGRRNVECYSDDGMPNVKMTERGTDKNARQRDAECERWVAANHGQKRSNTCDSHRRLTCAAAHTNMVVVAFAFAAHMPTRWNTTSQTVPTKSRP